MSKGHLETKSGYNVNASRTIKWPLLLKRLIREASLSMPKFDSVDDLCHNILPFSCDNRSNHFDISHSEEYHRIIDVRSQVAERR